MGVASFMGALSQSKEGDMQGGLDLANQRYAQQAADDAVAQGNVHAGLARMRGSQIAAQQKVLYTASGVDAGVGTPAATIAQTGMMSELDAQTLKNNAAREAWGYKVKAMQHGAQHDLDAQRTSDMVTGSLLTGLTSAAFSGYSPGSFGGSGGASGAGSGEISV